MKWVGGWSELQNLPLDAYQDLSILFVAELKAANERDKRAKNNEE